MDHIGSALLDLAAPTYARVCDRIRQDILSGRFEPGERLKITALIKRYGVSQMPVREALQQLQGEGLVVISPNCGASVRNVDERFVRNIYDLRGAIEVMMTRRCVEKLTDEHMVRLYGLEAQYEAAVQQQDLDAILETNRLLHRSIYLIADNTEAQQITERYSGLAGGLRHRYGFSEGRFEETIAEHRRLLRALDTRDGDLAAQVAYEHCCKAGDDLLKLLRS